MEERKNAHGIEYINEKVMFPWSAERAFPRVAKLMVNGGLNKEHFGNSFFNKVLAVVERVLNGHGGTCRWESLTAD